MKDKKARTNLSEIKISDKFNIDDNNNDSRRSLNSLSNSNISSREIKSRNSENNILSCKYVNESDDLKEIKKIKERKHKKVSKDKKVIVTSKKKRRIIQKIDAKSK